MVSGDYTSGALLIIRTIIYPIVIGLKNFYFPINSLAKLLSASLVLDSLLSDISRSESKQR